MAYTVSRCTGALGVGLLLLGSACGGVAAQSTSFDGGGGTPESSIETGPAPTDAGADVEHLEASTHDVAPLPEAGTFQEAKHSLPNITDNGGPVLAHPDLVTITYSTDTNASFEHALGAFMVQSAWLQTVGQEYGVGAGTHVSVLRPDAAPTTIDDSTIQSDILALIQAGTAPDPAADGGVSSATYMAFIPASTAITVGGSTLCQISGGGYHGETSGTVNGHTVSYSVVSECMPGLPVAPPQDLTWAASHEFIESATDPYPNSSPGYVILDTTQPWALIGGEVGDLCTYVFPQWTEGSYTALQRVYSNASAVAGGSPCIPTPSTYYGVDVEPQAFVALSAGSTTTFQMTGWSTAAVASWSLTAQALPIQGTAQPTVSLGTFTMQNGQTGQLTVGWPAGTPSQSYADILVTSAQSAADYTTAIVGVYVP
jgi:hypothetical protein